MKKIHFHIYFISFVLLFISNCKNSDTNKPDLIGYTVTGVATKVHVKIYENKTTKSLDEFSKKLEAIDKKYPFDKEPPYDELYKIKDISKDGDIILPNGVNLKLAGSFCGNDLVEYLQLTLKDENNFVIYIPSGYQAENITYAYIWRAHVYEDTYFDPPEIIKEYELLNENAILSNWCTPIEQPHHNYHNRYLELAKVNK